MGEISQTEILELSAAYCMERGKSQEAECSQGERETEAERERDRRTERERRTDGAAVRGEFNLSIKAMDDYGEAGAMEG